MAIKNISKEHILKEALLEIRKLKKEIKVKNSNLTLEPIAIIGMACRFPGGIGNPTEYWKALIDKKNMISSVPKDRWTDYSREKIENNPYLQKAGFLTEDIEAFDHQFFRLTPTEVARIDPQQKLFLKVSWEAIENSGYAPDDLKGSRTGVYAGASAFDHTLRLFSENTETSKDPTDLMGSSFSFISGRVSYFFGFQGPGITIDTACSSSLVAIDQACKGLLMGDCDMALAGGVNLMLSPETTELMASLNILSPNCEIRSFDASSNGTVRGEGCGVVVLKKLSAAERDGDKIHAIISASGSNQDGLSSGLTAPYGPAQEKLIKQVWERSGTTSRDIDFIEANGTGTQLGDPIEVSALANIIDKSRKEPLYIGTVKSSIGNLEAASGIAGLIKTVLALEHKTIPGNVNFEKPSLHVNWQHLPIKVSTKTTAWKKEKGNRKAAVNSFGLSGTNAHVVLQEYNALAREEKKELTEAVRLKKWPFRFSDVHSVGLKNQLFSFKEFVKQQVTISIKDVSYSQNISRLQQKQRLIIWAKDREELLKNLEIALEGKNSTDINFSSTNKKVVFLFNGQGSQSPQVFKTFYRENNIFKKYLDECNNYYKQIKHVNLIENIFANNQKLNETEFDQITLFAVEYALAKTWIYYGVKPTYFIGNDVGEYVAACLDNIFSLEDTIQLIATSKTLFEKKSKIVKYVCSSSRLIESTQSIKKPEAYIFLEIGPTGKLTQTIKTVLREKVHCNLLFDNKEESISTQLERNLFHLVNYGTNIDWKKYYNKQEFTRVFVPNYKFNEKHIPLKLHRGESSQLTNVDSNSLAHLIDKDTLSEEEKKHLPQILKVIKNAIEKKKTKENNITELSHKLKKEEEVVELIRQTLVEVLGFEEEELRNEESLLFLGIDSIIVARLIRKWREELRISLKPVFFFKKPTINAWAKIIFEKIKNKEEYVSDKVIDFVIDKENRYEKFNFTEVQNAYFVGKNPEIAWGGFTCYGYMEILAGSLNVEKFTSALNQLIERHEMLRCINHKDGKQQILPTLNYIPEVYTFLASRDIQEHLANLKKVMSIRTPKYRELPFELRLTEVAQDKWMIHFGIDLISSDALSINIFWKDLYKIYKGEKLIPLEVSFRDYITYLEKRKESNRFQIDKTYWVDRIETLPEAPKLPIEISKNHVFKGFGRKEQLLTKETWSAFVKSATKQNLTPSAALLALFSEVLSAWGGGNHFGIVLTVFERDNVHPQIDKVIGDFTQLSLLEIKREQQSIVQNGLAIQAQMQEDLGHLSYSSVDLIREMNNQRDGNFTYPIVFTSAIGVSDDLVGLGNKESFGETAFIGSQTPQVWLDSQVLIKNGQVCISWDYMKEIFPSGILDQMFGTYLELIHNSIHIKSFWNEVLTDVRPENQIQKHNKVNNTTKAFTVKTIHESILVIGATDKDKIAVVCNGMSYTYETLIKRANQVSETIQKNGIGKGDHVAIQMAKSFDMIATVLGIVQVGAVYIPIYNDNPVKRTSEILNTSNTTIIIVDTNCSLIGVLEEKVLTTKDFDKEEGNWEKVDIQPDDTAYIIYTSGSTGTPKGVEIAHKAADNTIQDINDRFKITSADRVLGISSLSFDLSVYDIFGVLGKGGTLVLPTESERIDPKCWKAISNNHHITLWNTVPALLELYVNYILKNKDVEPDLNIKTIFLSGDWIPLNLYSKIKEAIPNSKLISMGGATEASIWSNYYELNHMQENWRSIPYGYPLANQSFYVLDEFRRPCPDWVKGKLHIGGDGLAKGYYNAKELTKAAFFVHPELNIPLYDTGDYGRYTNDGILEFMGRKDAQLKINGYRVEIGEIQEAFRKCKNKIEPIILAIGDQMKSKKLIAYVQVNPTTFSEKDLKQELKNYIPSYFIPERIIALEEYPKTANGKIDRKTLVKKYQENYKELASSMVKTNQISQNHPVLLTVQKAFEMPQLKADDNFAVLGVSSMDIIRLANELEVDFIDRPAVVDMIRYQSVNDLIAFYAEREVVFEVEKSTKANSKHVLFNKEQLDYIDQLEIINNKEDQLEYINTYNSKPNHLNVLSVIKLEINKNTTQIIEEWSKHFNSFLDEQITKEDFNLFISEYFEHSLQGKKQFKYTSKIDVYSVHIYLTITKEKIEGISEGVYYLNTREGELQLVSKEILNWQFSQEKNHAFAVHFVADLKSIYPLLEEQSLPHCYTESGVIYQLMKRAGLQVNIGSGALIDGNQESITKMLQIPSQYYYLQSFVAGKIGNKKEQEAISKAFKNENINWRKEEENLRQLVKKCKQHDITLSTKEGVLKFKAVKDALTPEIKQELKNNKALLIPYLEALQKGAVSLITNPAYEPFELTPIQWAYLVGRRKDFELGNIPSHYYAEFECNQDRALKFEEALNTVIKNHEALRTVIYDNGTQQLLEEIPYFKIIEHFNATQETVGELRAKWSNNEYELGKWPMFHFEICHLNNNKSIIHISLDLMFIDAWSGDLMLTEIFNLTRGIKTPVSQLSFKDYIKKEKRWHRDNNYFLQKAEKYWKERLQYLPKAPKLPYIKSLNKIEKPKFKRWKLEISVEEVNRLTERAKINSHTATAIFCTAFMKILYEWSGNKGFTLNLTLFNRLPLHRDALKILGDFTNVGLASYEPNGKLTFLEEVEIVQKQLWELIEHRAKNGLELIRELGKDHPYKAVMPIIFTSLLSGESADLKENNLPEDFKELYAITQTPQVVIDHQIYRRGGNYIINWDVVEEAFDIEQLSYYFNKYKKLLAIIIQEDNWNKNINP